MPAPLIDEAEFPIVLVTFNGRPNDPEFYSVFEHIDGYLNAGKSYIAVMHVLTSEALTLSQRNYAGSFMKTRAEKLKELNMGNAFVSNSAVFRFVLSGILLVQPLAAPHIVTPSLDAALRWAKDLLVRSSRRISKHP